MRLHPLDGQAQHVAMQDIIGIEEQRVAARGMRPARHPRHPGPRVDVMLQEKHLATLLRQPPGNLGAAIGRGIVDKDHLAPQPGLPQGQHVWPTTRSSVAAAL